MSDNTKLIIVAFVLVSIISTCIYLGFIRPAHKAMLLWQYGIPGKAKIIGGGTDPTPGANYIFYLNSHQYYGGYNIENKSGVSMGDTVDIVYLADEPNVNMVPEEVKVYASSIWAIFVLDKQK